MIGATIYAHYTISHYPKSRHTDAIGCNDSKTCKDTSTHTHSTITIRSGGASRWTCCTSHVRCGTRHTSHVTRRRGRHDPISAFRCCFVRVYGAALCCVACARHGLLVVACVANATWPPPRYVRGKAVAAALPSTPDRVISCMKATFASFWHRIRSRCGDRSQVTGNRS